jgi:uncharacterized glyoxalase superfamily protein PhnB
MTLKQTRLVTIDVARLTQFYENVSQSKAEVLNRSYVQFQNEACKGLAIVELASTRAYGEDVAESGANRSVILDFEVDNVDAEYERLQESVSDWVTPPKVMPWGARAIVFRDPDGNLVNMYSHPYVLASVTSLCADAATGRAPCSSEASTTQPASVAARRSVSARRLADQGLPIGDLVPSTDAFSSRHSRRYEIYVS